MLNTGERMKIYLLAGLSILLIGMSSCSVSDSSNKTQSAEFNESDLSLALELDKDVYEKKEAILAVLSLVNQGESEFVINSRMAVNNSLTPEIVRDLEFIIMSPSGQKAELKVKVNVVPLGDDDFTPLQPGSSIQMEYDLEDFYLLNETGAYSVFAIYENQFDPNNNYSAWKGQIESNKLQFEIKK
jgi:hypothetical protein